MVSATVSAETGFRQASSAASNSPSYPSRRSISAIAARAKSSSDAPGRRASVGMTGRAGTGSWQTTGIGTFTRCNST